MVVLDGDDWFATPDALGIIHETYRRRNCWMTYGVGSRTSPIWKKCAAGSGRHIGEEPRISGMPSGWARRSARGSAGCGA